MRALLSSLPALPLLAAGFLASGLFASSLLAPGRAAAQVPPPPPTGYAAVTVALDDVLMPLLVAAEQDAAQSRPALALARARIVLEAAGPTSTLRVRADGVRLVAEQALAGAAPEAQPIETVLEPLVSTAESDSQRGLHALAIARADFVLARVPAGGPLALRTTAIRQAAAQLMTQGSAPTATPYGYGAPATPPTYGGVAGYGTAPQIVAPVATPPRPVAPADPTRRGDGEIIELYITAAVYGAYLGFWIPFASQLDIDPAPGASGNPEILVYTLTMLVGGGVFALGVAGLDSGDGLRTGVAPSLSVGLRYGLASGMLLWGGLDEEFDPTWEHSGMAERTAMPVVMGLAGGLVGAVVGFGMQPTVPQVRFVENSGFWGAGLGLFLSMAASVEDQQGFAITTAGLGLALTTTAIMAAAGANPSVRRSWLMTLGFVIGTGVAGLVTGLTSASGLVAGEDLDDVFGGVALATSLAGLVTVALLTDGMDAPRDEAPIPVQVGFGPTGQGAGAVATVSGAF